MKYLCKIKPIVSCICALFSESGSICYIVVVVVFFLLANFSVAEFGNLVLIYYLCDKYRFAGYPYKLV